MQIGPQCGPSLKGKITKNLIAVQISDQRKIENSD